MNRTKLGLVFAALLLVLSFTLSPAVADTPAIKECEGFDVPVSSNADVVTASITPATVQGATSASHPNVAYRMTVGITPGSDASVLELRITRGSVSFDYDLNDGAQLAAGRLYTFTFGASSSYTYNLQCETATRLTFLVERIEDGGL